MTELYQHPLWLTRLSWLCASAAAQGRYTGDLARIDAAVKLAERNLAQ